MRQTWSISMLNNTKNCTYCRVCGYDYEDWYPWGISGDCPTYVFCTCCDVEFGYQDCLPVSAKKFRAEWIKKGCPWSEPKFKPTEWKLEEQLKNIPEAFQDSP